MRKMMIWLMAFGLFGMVAGCKCSGSRSHAHGICDCEEDDHCASRQPWVQHGMHYGAPIEGETIKTPPTKLPDGKKL